MKPIIVVALTIQLTLAYHDPDLNYHLSQIQKVSNCDNGYSYAAPAVQLTTTGIKTAAPAATYLPQPVAQAPSYQYSGNAGYSSGITYQAVAPKITYAAQPAATYQTSSIASNYATAQGYATKEVHGYATSAGLSSASSGSKTVTPLATYAQAPIIAKVTAAPLIAKFSISPSKTAYVTQNLVQQSAYSTGSLAKASLNSYSNVQSGGPVVSQVYAAPSAGYATSPALRVQQPAQYVAPVQYSSVAAPTVAQYHQVSHVNVAPAVAHVAPAVAQYATSSSSVSHGSSISHGSSSASSSQYFTPVVSQHSGANIAQYSSPIVTQHSGPAVAQYAAPVVAQYSAPAVVQHSAPAIAQYSAQAVVPVSQYASAPVSVAHVSAPAVAAVAAPVAKYAAAPLAVKNVHSEFLENYDAHPRYAFEYSVNDPHTGDIKQQKEERDGEVVKGQYSLVEPDGSVRTVNYVADWETGFHADVRNSKDNQH
ncbi:uncharacterized protein LOC142973063 [Anticarsia gemmatalis]|uniref:uncharacterized protein LOC142973063 n=1 Tax=Anticarsia gemmatalis TaxID=129554 RepID=UPI003F76E335